MFFLRYILLSLLFILPKIALGQETSLIGRMQRAESSLVEIKTVYNRTLSTKSGRTGIASYERRGSGIIIDPSGIIVTNAHTILHAPKILVGFINGQVLEATVIHLNTSSDFSFLKVNAPFPLKSIPWAESSQAKIGNEVIALGNSELNDKSILVGKITSLLESKSTGQIEFLEVNISLYQGDSGGPILDKEGRLLGLIMGKRLTQDRKSYAIASDKIRLEYLLYK